MKFKDLGVNFFSYLFHCDLLTFFICHYLSISLKKKKCPCMHTQLCLTLQPHRLQPTRLLCLWDFPGKNTGEGCHFLLQCMKMKSESELAESCPTLSDPMDCSLPGSSVHGIFQARVLEWVAIASDAI